MAKNNYQGALQRPIGSGFGAASTTSDVIKGIDLAGTTAIVTGGYAGIGLETVKALTAAGARVIVPARNREKATRSLAGIANVEIEEMDLADAGSIDAFADRFLASGRALHVLINNAGIMWAPLRRDERGNESQLSTNYLGHFQLTARLWSALVMARGARVVNVSSWGHHYSPVVFDDPNFLAREYDTLSAYGQSKTASTLFSLELDVRGKGAGVRAYAVHPGIIAGTELSRDLPREALQKFGALDADHNPIHDLSKGLKTLSQGASTTVWCATSPALADIGGVYCEDADIAQLDRLDAGDAAGVIDTALMRGVAPHALDEQAAQRLWVLSEQLSGMKFQVTNEEKTR
ncbi:SDR family NAD(P)-dependent oxidoreductase [Duganella aceris]|uniref:SDR family NAD(P)-dependent oxidoreductase n=1 Tax=Duganella aceris TaxID=2703883 RepID=A0ABX0FN23_9BURK|nr:SDR family NAD(P)-dependent oxidoreductase [Duganella aceris]NGZ85912.1 SDR family NAD(P)-dependent oxidoreductase [Duganella aceris]